MIVSSCPPAGQSSILLQSGICYVCSQRCVCACDDWSARNFVYHLSSTSYYQSDRTLAVWVWWDCGYQIYVCGIDLAFRNRQNNLFFIYINKPFSLTWRHVAHISPEFWSKLTIVTPGNEKFMQGRLVTEVWLNVGHFFFVPCFK